MCFGIEKTGKTDGNSNKYIYKYAWRANELYYGTFYPDTLTTFSHQNIPSTAQNGEATPKHYKVDFLNVTTNNNDFINLLDTTSTITASGLTVTVEKVSAHEANIKLTG